MVTAIILMKAVRERINAAAQELSGLPGISEVFSVSGRYDLVAIARVRDNDELAELATNRMAAVEGITASETMLAFRAFSKHDLESMFAVGFED
jgi:DNA-binding Lrp family transcriptional regulator